MLEPPCYQFPVLIDFCSGQTIVGQVHTRRNSPGLDHLAGCRCHLRHGQENTEPVQDCCCPAGSTAYPAGAAAGSCQPAGSCKLKTKHTPKPYPAVSASTAGYPTAGSTGYRAKVSGNSLWELHGDSRNTWWSWRAQASSTHAALDRAARCGAFQSLANQPLAASETVSTVLPSWSAHAEVVNRLMLR